MTSPQSRAAVAALCTALVAAGAACTSEITIDTAKRYQTIAGFGTCLISWVDGIERLYRTPEFQATYADAIGLSMLRIELWPGVSTKPVADPRQIRWQDFDFTGAGRRGRVFVDFAEAIHRRNPNEFTLIGSAWSPPGWMKTSGRTTGDGPGSISRGEDFDNRLAREYYPHFAQWLAEWVKLFEAKGIKLAAVSAQNEPVFTQKFNSCTYTPEQYAELIDVVARTFEREGLSWVKLFGPEDMTFDLRRNTAYLEALDRAGALEHLDVWASHGYLDGFQVDPSEHSPARLWALVSRYRKPYWMTEGGTGDHEWPAPLYELAPMLHNSLVGGHASAIVPWQITGKEPSGHALMVMERSTRKTNVAQHYFKYIRPGAVRVAAGPSDGAVAASAYVHDGNGTLTVVLTNPTRRQQQVALRLLGTRGLEDLRTFRTSVSEAFAEIDRAPIRAGRVALTLPAQSIVTLHGAGTSRSPVSARRGLALQSPEIRGAGNDDPLASAQVHLHQDSKDRQHIDREGSGSILWR